MKNHHLVKQAVQHKKQKEIRKRQRHPQLVAAFPHWDWFHNRRRIFLRDRAVY